MNTKRLLLIVALIAPLFFLQLHAVPAVPYPVKVTQPDGQTLTIRIHGDEFFSYVTTTDGYLLKQNSQGIYEYAFLNAQKNIETTGVPAHDLRSNSEMLVVKNLKVDEITPAFELSLRKQNASAQGRPQYGQANPLHGEARGVVILVNFTDTKFTVSNPKQRFTRLLNEPGYSDNGCTGCAAEYFAASSDSAFTPIFDVYGPYNLSHDVAYYGANSGDIKSIRARDMVTEACGLADNDCDFSKYDTDSNGIVDNVFIYYAGHNEAEGGPANTIWPHRSVIGVNLVLDGKKINDYACTSELRGSAGATMCGPGTFCHEFSHVLGLPDLYDTDYSSRTGTPGSWDIMDQGSYNNGGCTPPTYSAAERFFLGYLTPTLLSDPRPCTLHPLISGKEAFLISPTNAHNLNGTAPNPQQYFLLENRQLEGWDANSYALPATGMLITRIDYSAAAWANNSVNDIDDHRRVAIMHASGTGANPGSSVFPGDGNVTAYYPTTWEGTRIDGSVTSIKKIGNNITFLFRGGGEGYPKATLTIQKSLFETEQGTPSDSIQATIAAQSLTEPLVITFSDTRHYEVKLSTDNVWKKSISITPEDSVVNCTIDIRYNPTTASGSKLHETYLELIHDNSILDGVELEGRSSKALKITIPVATEATNITSNSFTANWEPVQYATCYYVTVFANSNGNYTDKETFTELFSEESHGGWNCNFTTTTNRTVPSKPVALLFTSENDRLTTPYYPSACTEISFWVRTEDMKQNGFLYVEGRNDSGWDTLQTIKVNKSLTAQTKSITTKESDGYRQFRFTVDSLSTSGLAFDDFAATYAMKTVQNRIKVYGELANIGNLDGSTEYSYMVQASDEDLTAKTENVTDYSNRINVTTTQSVDGKKKNNRIIPVKFDDMGNPIISFTAEDLKDKDGNNLDIYIFNAQGILIRTIPNSEFAGDPSNICIKDLPTNSISIITLGIGHKNKFVKITR